MTDRQPKHLPINVDFLFYGAENNDCVGGQWFRRDPTRILCGVSALLAPNALRPKGHYLPLIFAEYAERTPYKLLHHTARRR